MKITSISINNITKKYNGELLFKNLHKIEELDYGLYILTGFSGIGKTTFINILATLEKPDQTFDNEAGVIYRLRRIEKVKDENTKETTKKNVKEIVWNYNTKNYDNNIIDLRNSFIKLISQDFSIIENFNALDNIFLNSKNKKLTVREVKALQEFTKKIFNEEKLLQIGLKDMVEFDEYPNDEDSLIGISKLRINSNKSSKKVKDLSGGEKQKIALLRALFHNNEDGNLILADEPFNQVDIDIKKHIIEKFIELASNNIVIIITHDINFADCKFNTVEDFTYENCFNDKMILKKYMEKEKL